MTTLLRILSGLLVRTAHAQNPFERYCDALGTYCGDGRQFIVHLADRVVDTVVIPFIGGIAVIGVLWASIKMIASGGNDQGKEDAKNIIMYVLAGVALAAIGKVLVMFACNLVQGTTGGSAGVCG